MAKHWKAIALIVAFMVMQFAGRFTALLADVAVCVGIYYFLMSEYKKTFKPKE